jgi:hypothetical protein
MDIVKKDIKKKKQKAKAKAKAKTKPTQTQTQKVIVNLQDVFKKKRKSPRKTTASTRVSAANRQPQVIYQPAPMALQPDLASIIREQLSKSMPQPTLTRSVVQQDVPQLTRTRAPAQLRASAEPDFFDAVGEAPRQLEPRPTILEDVDEDPLRSTSMLQPVGMPPFPTPLEPVGMPPDAVIVQPSSLVAEEVEPEFFDAVGEAPRAVRGFAPRQLEPRPTILEDVDEEPRALRQLNPKPTTKDRPTILEDVDEDPPAVLSEDQRTQNALSYILNLPPDPAPLQPVGMPVQEPAIGMETSEDKPKRGRPRGFVPSEETKAKTRASVKATNAAKKAVEKAKEASTGF